MCENRGCIVRTASHVADMALTKSSKAKKERKTGVNDEGGHAHCNVADCTCVQDGDMSPRDDNRGDEAHDKPFAS